MEPVEDDPKFCVLLKDLPKDFPEFFAPSFILLLPDCLFQLFANCFTFEPALAPGKPLEPLKFVADFPKLDVDGH